MSQTVWSEKRIMALSIAAASATIVAGILHLVMVPRSISRNPLEGILFLVGGILQVFWALPVMKRWGRVWQIIGIAGTGVFVLLWLFDRLHVLPEGMPPQGQEAPRAEMHPQNMSVSQGERPQGGSQRPFISGTALPIEIAQVVFIGLYALLAGIISKKNKPDSAHI